MIVDGGRDFFRLSLNLGVEPADNSLKFCEFLHHLRGQIALAKLDGPQNMRGLSRFQRSRMFKCCANIFCYIL